MACAAVGVTFVVGACSGDDGDTGVTTTSLRAPTTTTAPAPETVPPDLTETYVRAFTDDTVDIADVAVFGVPDERTGERVVAAVVPTAGASPTVESIGAFLRAAGLRNQALPERVDVIDALPRNPAGKVLKRELQKNG